jgi:zinc protease
MSGSFPSAETIARAELPNDIVVLAYENPHNPSVVIGGYLWAGSQSEAAEQAGLASFTAGMLMRGTENRSFGQINESLESAGAQLSFHTGGHTTSFGGKALVEDLDLLLDILADSLTQPTFPEKEVEKLRGQILTALQRRAFNTRSMARLTFDALLFPDHPYGRSVLGYEETVSALSREDLANHYHDRYSPRGMVVSVVGAIPTAVAIDRVQQALGKWRAPEAIPDRGVPSRLTLTERRRQFVPIEGKTQSDIVLGWQGLARKDPDYMKARLANTILGVFGIMGRLGDSVRDKQGLAYYVYSQLEAGLGAGPWVSIAGVDPVNVERAVEGILQEVRRLRDEPVAEEELSDSQSFMTGSMPLRLETNEGISSTLLTMEQYDLGLDYLLRFADLVNAVTAQEIQDVAQAYLDPEVYALAISGPQGT